MNQIKVRGAKQPKRTVEMSKYQTVLIFHNNCKKNCKHCFCKPSPACNVEETRQLIDSLQQRGNNVRVYITDQTQPNILTILKRVGYDTVELKDKLEPIYVKELAQTNPRFGFSLHGHRADIHELLCQKGNFQETIKALKEAKRLNLRNVRVYSVIHRKNYSYIGHLCSLVEKYGVSKVIFLRLAYGGMARALAEDIFLDQESYIQFFQIFESVKKKFRNRMDITLESNHWGPQYSRLKICLIQLLSVFTKKQKFSCIGGRDKICIHSKTREIFPCYPTVAASELRLGYYDKDKGIVIENPLWLNDLIEKIGEPCKTCKLLRWCGGHCRGLAISDHMRLTGEFSLYAGHTYCPVALGITKALDMDEIIELTDKLFNLPSRFFSKARNL